MESHKSVHFTIFSSFCFLGFEYVNRFWWFCLILVNYVSQQIWLLQVLVMIIGSLSGVRMETGWGLFRLIMLTTLRWFLILGFVICNALCRKFEAFYGYGICCWLNTVFCAILSAWKQISNILTWLENSQNRVF